MAKIENLWLHKKFADYDSLFEMSFDREIMRSERTRSLIVCIISCLIIIWLLIVKLFFSDYFASFAFNEYHGYNLYTWLAFIFGALALYELGYAIALLAFLKKERMFPFFPRVVNAMVEIIVPSAITFFMFKVLNSIEVLFTPTVFIYFVFISLSSLRLFFSLSLFSGIGAGAGYIAVSLYVIQHARFDAAYASLFNPMLHIAKGLILILVGLATALVSQQIKKRMRRSLKMMEEKNRIVGMFGQHVSPEVVNKLLEQKGELGSETKYVCMMFMDIRNFTKFAESSEPERVVNYLNTLFDFMIDIINENKGIINKFLGDGFMAVFGAPFSDGEDSRNAVNAARGILSRLEEEIQAGRIAETRIGIGIHAGKAITGNVGSRQRKEYTIIGDVVNIASRIEQLNKTYGSQILVSDEVWRSIERDSQPAEDLGSVEIRGHAGPVHIYKLA